MAISRFLMNRQLRANGGIMDVTPRENFGLGSSLKKFVRKIIPNEVADIAVKAAPFVAPFNPALAGVMGGLGSFDQTGSISSGLKSGAMNYGGGQLARYAGGAGFQGNPFGQGGAFTQGGFQGGFSSPLGNQTGLGKLFSNQGTDPVQGINSGRGGDSASALSRSTANVPGAEAINITPTNLNDYVGTAADIIPTNLNDYASMNKDTILQNNPGVFNSITESIKNFDYKGLGEKTLELGKKFGKAMFTKPNPIPGGKPLIDKAAVMGAIAFTGSYIEAKALADDAGVELTEEAYDEARKTEKQEEYAGYLTNFFGGKKDGGRIGFKSGYSPGVVSAALEEYNSVYGTDSSGEEILVKDLYSGGFEEFLDIYTGDAYEKKADGGRIGYGNGANEFMSEQMMLESNPGAAESGSPITIDTTMTGLINKYNTYKKSAPGVSEETRIFLKNDLLKSLEDAGISQEEFMMRLSEDTEMKANGGRIGYALGTPRNTTMFEELNADTIYRPKPDSTITLPNEMPGGDNRMPGDDRRVDKYDDYEFDQDQKTDSIRLLADFYMREEGMSESDAYEKAVGEIYDIQLKEGGRVEFNDGGSVITLMDGTTVQIPDGAQDSSGNLKDIIYSSSKGDLLREEIIRKLSFAKGGRVSRKLGSPEEGERSGVMEMLAVDVDAGGDDEEDMLMAYKPGSFYKKDFKPMEVDAINERLQSFLDSEGGGLPLPLVGAVKGIANTLKAGKPVFTGPEKTTIIRNLAGRSRGTSAYKELGKSIPEAKRIMDNPIDYLKDAAIFKELLKGIFKKDGGRIGLRDGTGGNRVSQLLILRDEALSKGEDTSIFDAEIFQLTGKTFKSIGGISEIPTGEPRLNAGGVAERDYRETGGFVPVGIKERADDVPAMLSKNEFVMTADSVRGLGNGSVEEGSKKLYNTMKQAEQKGKIA
jgi:hypothetical protein